MKCRTVAQSFSGSLGRSTTTARQQQEPVSHQTTKSVAKTASRSVALLQPRMAVHDTEFLTQNCQVLAHGFCLSLPAFRLGKAPSFVFSRGNLECTAEAVWRVRPSKITKTWPETPPSSQNPLFRFKNMRGRPSVTKEALVHQALGDIKEFVRFVT